MDQRSQLLRLVEVMRTLRENCPWDAEQTHHSLVHYLVEETCEVVDAIESGSDADLCEELGDLLLQVVFHATIAAETDRFTIDDVAAGISNKLVERHPYVFSDAEIPDDLNATWEARKRTEKGRTSSLDGIPTRLSALARANKVITRARTHGVTVDLPGVPVSGIESPLTAEDAGAQMLALVARAQAGGIDPEQALRDALRGLEDQIRLDERRTR